MKKTILFTGSCGFVGSNFIRKALYQKSDYNIVSIDVCKNSNLLNNIYANKGHKFYIGDITDKHLMNVIFEVERPDIVIHAAAETHVDESIHDPLSFVKSNVLGTQVVIDSCLKWKVEKLIYISTDEVYGQLTDLNVLAWTEDSPLSPRNSYSASKASGELLIQAAHQTHGLQYNITRCSNNFGPRQQARNLIPKIIKHVLENKSVPIYGKGQQLREWIFVEDHCSAIMNVLEQGAPNQIYNISSGYEFSNVEVFHEICNIMGKGHELLKFVEDRPGHDYRYAINSNKLRSLGWAPAVKFKAGLATTCDWYTRNYWFIK